MFTVLFGLHVILAYASDPQLHHSWKSLEYDWISPQQKEQYLADGRFIPENNALAGFLFSVLF
jgi:hypothetical protein